MAFLGIHRGRRFLSGPAKRTLRSGVAFLLGTGLVATTLPAVAQVSDHSAGVQHRGDQGMGFSHEKTTHHFKLLTDGGAIEVDADDPQDQQSRDAIRAHLSHIVLMFRGGDFDIPMFIHATTPPGVPVMKRLKDRISYDAEPTTRGAQVRIRTADRRALLAVHRFLRFQIRDHQTGDSTSVLKD